MKLLEYQAKSVFAQHGIQIPRGEVVEEASRAAAVADELGGPTVLKPQLGVKGRGKVGGIGFADDSIRAGEIASKLLGSKVKGELVERLLVEARIDIRRELYLAVVVDYAARCPVIMASSEGGVEIEQVAIQSPDAIIRVPCSMLAPPSDDDLRPIRDALGAQVAEVARILYQVFRDYEAELVEINPLVEAPGGLWAVDGVLNVNDAAVDRHAELRALAAAALPGDPLADEAKRLKWTYIDLGGDVAILSSGAGLTMTIVDLLEQRGVRPANFLDTAQFDEHGIYQAFELLRRARPAKVWLVNIFAGLNRCDRLAQGIARYLGDHPLDEPLVVRMVGNFEEEGHRILQGIGIEPVRELERAIERCVELVSDGRGGSR